MLKDICRNTKDKIHKKLLSIKQHMLCLIFVYITHTQLQQITHLMFSKIPMPLIT